MLADLWARGMTASQCALEIGNGRTRNSIIGKVTRLRLPNRDEVGLAKKRDAKNEIERKRNSAIRKEQRNAKDRAKRDAAREEKTRQTLHAPVLDETPNLTPLKSDIWKPFGRQLLNILQLNEHTCKWPIGDPKSPDFGFCGAHVHEMPADRAGRKNLQFPYCLEHRTSAFIPREKK